VSKKDSRKSIAHLKIEDNTVDSYNASSSNIQLLPKIFTKPKDPPTFTDLCEKE
jgi:hypothetical protein